VGDVAETLASGRSLMRSCPIWILGWVSLCKRAVYGWIDDQAATMGAAIAYYTVFSLAPMLVMVIGVAGLAFGREAAEGALFGELANSSVRKARKPSIRVPRGGASPGHSRGPAPDAAVARFVEIEAGSGPSLEHHPRRHQSASRIREPIQWI
jgi:hypothetical protein